MKIEKVKARTMYMFEGQEFGSLVEAQRARLVDWLSIASTEDSPNVPGDIADAIILDADGFREAAGPFLIKRRGPRKSKAMHPELNLELGEDGEPQAVDEAA